MKNKILTIVFLLAAISVSAQVKTVPVDTLETHLKSSLLNYYKKYPQEKVFVHTNQPVYCNGETIWYKVYTMAYGKPSALSKIIYIQLSDTTGNIITQNKLPLLNGTAHGNIEIGQKIKTGWYKLSAFTSWMMNFGPQGYYTQQIYIRNLDAAVAVAASNEKKIVKDTYHINFYPEGGDMIDGNITRIAYKAYTGNGEAAQVTGTVRDATNKTVARLTTQHDGMGAFIIEADARNAYTVMVQFPDGSKQEIALPKVKETGISLQTAQNAANIQVRVSFSGDKEKLAGGILVASQNSGQVATYPLQLDKGANLFELKKEIFSTGILRLTFFDHNGLPQAERIVFVNNHDLQMPVLKADTLSVSPRRLNSFSVALKDKAGMHVKGNFSVAVTDGDAFEKNGESQDIFSALLLSPELQGTVHNPGYYFKNQSDSLAAKLDLVMLTNGWRHFIGQKLLNNENLALNHPVEQSQYIAGKVIGYPLPGKDPLNIKLLIMNADSTKFIGSVMPDNTGSFILKNFDHNGLSDIYMQTTDKKNRIKKSEIKMLTTLGDSLKQAKTEPFRPPVAAPNFTEYYISGAESEEKFRLQANSILLNTINIEERKTTPTQKLIDEHVSPRFETDREFTLDLVNNPTLNMSIVDYMRGRFPGLQIINSGTDAVFIYRGGSTLQGPPPPPKAASSSTPVKTPSAGGTGMTADISAFLPYFYLNEALVDFGAVKDMQLSEVALIRFMPPPVYFAPYNGGNTGAIMIYTKIQSDEMKKMIGISDYNHYVFNGYNVTREFSVPDYNNAGRSPAADNRTTLYWNHDLNTDNNGVLKFKFYNSDRAKKFKVVLQGMDGEGRMVYLEQAVQ